MKKTYGISAALCCAMLTAGTCLGAAAESGRYELFSDTIELVRPDDYQYDREEVMYLSGVRVSAYTPGVRYTLRDMNEDGVSELIVSVKDDAAVYAYDEDSDQAVRTMDYGKDLENILRDDTVIWVDDTQWPDGSVFGTVLQTGDPGIRTDYYASSNYEWLSGSNVKTQGDSTDRSDFGSSVEEKKQEMFYDREKYQGEDIQRIRDLYDIASNWDRREEEGIGPVMKYLDAIDRIDSISAMSDYLADPEQDPFCTFAEFHTTLDLEDTSRWIVQIRGDEFSILPRQYHNSDEQEIALIREEYDATVRYVLEKAGYEAQEIDRIMDESYAIENALLEKDWPDEEEDEEDELLSQIPIGTMASKCRNFPLDLIFEAYHITKGSAVVEYPDYLRTLDSLYTEEHLSGLKSYCLAHTAYKASSYLDLETKNAYFQSTDQDGEYTAESLNESCRSEFLSNRGIMGVAAENAYMNFFVDDEARADITLLANEIKDTFRGILENEEWMSEAGRKACIEKLDHLEFCILKPDTLIDSAYLSVDPDSCFLDAYASVIVNTRKHYGELVGQEQEKGEWRYDISPEAATTVNNCFYYGAYNQFFILDGFLNDGTYRLDMTPEEKLGTLGEVIGHELTHGFDPNGIQYDQDGNKVVTDENPYGWMPKEDYEAYKKRADKLSDYFSRFVPFPYNRSEGTIWQGEAAADIAGMTIGLGIASKLDQFDYDLYFRSHSGLWAKQSTLVVERGDIFDEHPLYYLRINAVCQQFEEFFDTYDIQEGDFMYLAPEDRINIW